MSKLKIITDKTPCELGFHFPAEFEKQESIWLSWPHNVNSWPDGNGGKIELQKMLPDYARFITEISRYQKVCINVNDEKMKLDAKAYLLIGKADFSNTNFFFHPTNDAWCRDHGPSFIVNRATGEKAIVDWDFNAWGGKYPYDLDNKIPSLIAQVLNLPVFKPCVILEGGSVDFNGNGTVLTTRECLLNPNRNSGINQSQIEQYLVDYFGVSNVIWLNQGIGGNDTNGHIDDLTRFVNPTTVITMYSEDKRTRDYKILNENLELLKKATLENGKSLNIVPIPLPKKIIYKGQQVPASYANFLITNRLVIVPIFNDEKNDRIAIDTLSCIFPDRKVIGLNSKDIIWGLGSFHCLSQQEPAI